VPTISTYHLDDKSTFSFSWAILDDDVAPFNTSVFLPHWVNSPAFEDWNQCLETLEHLLKAEQGWLYLVVDFAREFILGYLSMYARRTVEIFVEEFIPNQGERCICGFRRIQCSQY